MDALDTVQEEHCTLFARVPTMFVAILDHPTFAHHDLTSLRRGFIVGAPCSAELMRRIANEMPMRDVMIGYGRTVASGGVSQTAPDGIMHHTRTATDCSAGGNSTQLDPPGRETICPAARLTGL